MTVVHHPAPPRASGVLLHLTSLPSPYGIGDLGGGARQFVDFLRAAGQRYWQFLPVAPVDLVFSASPYMSLAALAGNPLLISPQGLAEEGLLTRAEIEPPPTFSEYQVDFPTVIAYKQALIKQACRRLPTSTLAQAFAQFCQAESAWLDDYALFMSLRDQEGRKPWYQWDKPLRHRVPAALRKGRALLAQAISSYQGEQFLFFHQWQQLRDYAHRQGVLLIGDLPIYVGLDSADVWANQDCFQLDPTTSSPTHVAGVPPDYFSKTGQRWGNPLYLWQTNQQTNQALVSWWRQRFRQIGQLVDAVRIDHFRAFESYWQVPAEEKTAINGQWVKGPGEAFFAEMREELAGLSIIAEDLGVITPEVIALRDSLGLPGMKILQFAFDSDERNLYLPHNFTSPHCLCFSGTHDNNTTLGWYLEDAGEAARARCLRLAHSDGHEIHWDIIRLALSSIAETAIIPMQDLLGFGSDCRMNCPGESKGNWQWRCAARFLTAELANRLLDETTFYHRTS